MLPTRYFHNFIKMYSVSKNTIRRFSDQQIVVSKKAGTSLNTDKKPCKPPFMKNVFLGVYDTDMLIYPELSIDKLQELKNKVKPIKDFFEASVDPRVISSLNMIPNEVREHLKDQGLFGQIIPCVFGGNDQTATETAYINELIARDLNIALSLYCHNFHVGSAIVSYGSSQQKEKYLSRLASGELLAAFCMSESSTGSDLATLSTKLSPSDNNTDIFIINGKKKWVVNAVNANLFLVVVKSDITTYSGKIIPAVRLVLVERDAPGITVSKTDEFLGLNASGICDVSFKDTPVSKDCFIDTSETEGFKMCTDILDGCRYNIGAITVSVLKQLLAEASEFVISRQQFERPLYESELIQYKFAEVATCIYALESMTFHTAGLLDTYNNQDCAIEQAIVKVFSFTEGRRSLDLIMEIMGGRSFVNCEILQNYFKNFRTMEVFDGTTDIANLFISLLGVQHAGGTMHESVSKMRFFQDYPTFVIKQYFVNRKQLKDDPKLTLKLFEQLHPSLKEAADNLEYCVLRLPFAVSLLLSRYGTEAVNQQIELRRLASAAVKIYAMTCVLSRASRSYCIGLRNAEEELKYAISICQKYKPIVQMELNYLIDGIVMSGDLQNLKFGPNILKHHGYFLQHALERSY